jgi:stage III sporulation protein AH
LQQLINNPNVSKEAKTEAENKLLALQEKMEMELLVENAIKAQGFKNAILILQEDGALVIVDAPELSSQQVLLIAQIASQATGLRASQINISAQGGK